MGITHGDDDTELAPPASSHSEGAEQQPEDLSTADQHGEDAPASDAAPAGAEDAPPAAEAEADKRREALIAELTGAAPPKPDTEAETPPTDEAAPAAQAKDEEELEDPENIPDDEFKALKRRTRKRIEHFRAELAKAREREPMAKYGEDIIAFARAQNIDPDQLAGWIGMAPAVNQGGQKAIDTLIGMARKFGYEPPQVSPAAPAPRSDQQSALPDWLQAKVDSFDIAPEVAQEIARRLPAPTPAPAAAPAPAQAPPPQQTRSAAPDAEIQAGVQELERLIAEGASKYPADWEKRIFPAVQAKMAEFRGSPPSQWPRLFKLAQEAAVASIRTPPTAPKAPLTPGAGSGAAGQAKSPRAALVARLTGG